MVYNIAIKNKDKKEFDFYNNRNCIDFNAGKGLYGSFCCDEYEFYIDNDIDYDIQEAFKGASKKAIKAFLNLKNKKEYQEDTIVKKSKIKILGKEYILTIQLTYCP